MGLKRLNCMKLRLEEKPLEGIGVQGFLGNGRLKCLSTPADCLRLYDLHLKM